jgi:hypothetical protein
MCFRGGSPSPKRDLERWRKSCISTSRDAWEWLDDADETEEGVLIQVLADRGSAGDIYFGRWRPVMIQKSDAAFIKAARQALPALLDDVERYQRLIEELEVENTCLKHEVGELRMSVRGVVSGTILVAGNRR